jgi:hypothetical protein
MDNRRQRAAFFGRIPEEEIANLTMHTMEADLRFIYKMGDKIDPKRIDKMHVVKAVEDKSLWMLRCLIKHRMDVTINNNAALLIAAQRGYHLIVKELVQYCDPTVPDNYALRWACLNGHGLVVTELLNSRKVDARCNQNDPLVLAASRGHVTVCKELLNWGVKPDRRSYEWARAHKPVRDLFVEYGYKTIMTSQISAPRRREWTGKRSSRVNSNDENEQPMFAMDV